MKFVLSWFGVAWGILGCALGAQASGPCDPTLSARSPTAYQWRGSYCEGACRQDVSAQAFELVSLAWAPNQFTSAVSSGEGDLLLHWDVPKKTRSLRLRIRSLDPSLCYRLDAEFPPDQTSFPWPIRLATSLGLATDPRDMFESMGLLLEATLEDESRLWVPLHIGRGPAKLEARVLPGTALSSLVWSLESAQSSQPLIDGASESSYLPRGEAVSMPLECVQEGPWRLEVGATIRAAAGRQPAARDFSLHLDCPELR